MARRDFEKNLTEIRLHIPTSNPGQIAEFMKTTVYLDFKNEMISRIEHLRDDYEKANSKEWLEMKGGIAVLREMVAIFEDLHHNSKQREE